MFNWLTEIIALHSISNIQQQTHSIISKQTVKQNTRQLKDQWDSFNTVT